jgi:hypothetical protein
MIILAIAVTACGQGDLPTSEPYVPPPIPEVKVGTSVPLDVFVDTGQLEYEQRVRLRNGPFIYRYPCYSLLSKEERFDLGYDGLYDRRGPDPEREMGRGRECSLEFVPPEASLTVVELPDELPGEALLRLDGWAHPLMNAERYPCSAGDRGPDVPQDLKMMEACPAGALFYGDVERLTKGLMVPDPAVDRLKKGRQERIDRVTREYLRRKLTRGAE